VRQYVWSFPKPPAMTFMPYTHAVREDCAVPFSKQAIVDLRISIIGEISEDMVERKIMKMGYPPILHQMENLLVVVKCVVADLIDGSLRRTDICAKCT
jgi:hypothetical protein